MLWGNVGRLSVVAGQTTSHPSLSRATTSTLIYTFLGSSLFTTSASYADGPSATWTLGKESRSGSRSCSGPNGELVKKSSGDLGLERIDTLGTHSVRDTGCNSRKRVNCGLGWRTPFWRKTATLQTSPHPSLSGRASLLDTSPGGGKVWGRLGKGASRGDGPCHDQRFEGHM